MGTSFRASSLLAVTVALGCGGKALGGSTDVAPRDAAGGQDLAADDGVPSEDAGVTTEVGAGAVDTTISDVSTVPDAWVVDRDAAEDSSSESDGPSEAGCIPTTCAQLGEACGVSGDGCGGIIDCGSCAAPQYCGGGGPNRCGPSGTNADASAPPGDAGSCGTGTVTFQLDPGPGGPWQASQSGDEEPNWLAVFTAAGTPLYRNPPEWASADCDCSRSWAVPIGWVDFVLTDAGTPQSWDGLYFDTRQFGDSGGCPSAGFRGYPGESCLVPGCAPPGRYVAYMCACSNVDASSSSTFSRSGVPSSYAYYVADCANPTCVRVPFEYPSQTLVVGTVSASDE